MKVFSFNENTCWVRFAQVKTTALSESDVVKALFLSFKIVYSFIFKKNQNPNKILNKFSKLVTNNVSFFSEFDLYNLFNLNHFLEISTFLKTKGQFLERITQERLLGNGVTVSFLLAANFDLFRGNAKINLIQMKK
ncbi:hypothetical protein BpHYR1_019750 [Brachionus plicatilis]|uniref:Uncharacterized protein n=1 Tax=Brachionus plicatilis TaxID=10195 RepID=A0A3M7RYZ0_BRAPC|nr:hypothetical protein BpHYR1_019750 [Brachionus plicatilis]